MVEFRAVLLRPVGPFREIPRADTLFGAIANAVSTLDGTGAVEELVMAFKNGARISSAFPYLGDTFYLPKPLTAELMDFSDPAKAKKIKRARYLDLKNFEKALKLEPFEVPDVEPYTLIDVPKVSLDRVTQDSDLYFWEEIRFKDGAGLYFLYKGPDSVFKEFIEPAVRFLSDTGIGGKATWGSGLFEPSFGRVKINAPQSPYAVTLSNALPSKRPVLWNLLKKGGWSFGRRKPKMRFILEGSIVKDDPGRFERLDLALPFPVYVYGLTFQVPALLPEGLE